MTAGPRHSLRLPAYDYAWTGSYFVTVCIQGRVCALGAVAGGVVALSEIGQMVDSWWNSIPGRFPTVGLDAYVVMPNHLHGILQIGRDTEKNDRRGRPPCLPFPTADQARSENDARGIDRSPYPIRDTRPSGDEGRHGGLPLRLETPTPGEWPIDTVPVSLGRVMQWFKSATTKDYGVGVRDYAWPPYERRLWQRNYYEHVVRDEADLSRIRAYIEHNPARWAEDEEYQQ
jgi:putative transposase